MSPAAELSRKQQRGDASSRDGIPEGILQLNCGDQAAAQNSARNSKGVDNIGGQQPELRHHLVCCQRCSAQLARHRQSQEKCCLHCHDCQSQPSMSKILANTLHAASCPTPCSWRGSSVVEQKVSGPTYLQGCRPHQHVQAIFYEVPDVILVVQINIRLCLMCGSTMGLHKKLHGHLNMLPYCFTASPRQNTQARSAAHLLNSGSCRDNGAPVGRKAVMFICKQNKGLMCTRAACSASIKPAVGWAPVSRSGPPRPSSFSGSFGDVTTTAATPAWHDWTHHPTTCLAKQR